jgi:hypothetical protein
MSAYEIEKHRSTCCWGRGRSAARLVHGWLPVVEAEGIVAAAGLQAGADVADDVGGKAGHVVPADFAALAWFGVNGFAGPSRGGEEDADAGLSVGVGVVAQVGEGEVGGGDGDADFLDGFAGRCRWESLAFVKGIFPAVTMSCPRIRCSRGGAAAPSRRW